MEALNEGFFLSLEGIEGSGKGTQARLLYEHLLEEGYDVKASREPGATAVGGIIRDTLLNPKFKEMTVKTELLLFAACRAQHVDEVLVPAIEAGKIVICDRFVDSTLAYQSFGRGLEFQEVLRVSEWAAGGLFPDLTILLDLPVEAAFSRIEPRDFDRIEQADAEFHRRVRDGFLELAQMYPDRIKMIDADREPGIIHKEITGIVKELL